MRDAFGRDVPRERRDSSARDGPRDAPPPRDAARDGVRDARDAADRSRSGKPPDRVPPERIPVRERLGDLGRSESRDTRDTRDARDPRDGWDGAKDDRDDERPRRSRWVDGTVDVWPAGGRSADVRPFSSPQTIDLRRRRWDTGEPAPAVTPFSPRIVGSRLPPPPPLPPPPRAPPPAPPGQLAGTPPQPPRRDVFARINPRPSPPASVYVIETCLVFSLCTSFSYIRPQMSIAVTRSSHPILLSRPVVDVAETEPVDMEIDDHP